MFSKMHNTVGITREGLYKEFSEDGNPTFVTVTKVVKATHTNK